MDTGALCYRRYLDGDDGGFDEIIRLYHDNLIYFIYRYVKNFETAEDLAADTFMELIVHKKRYSFKSSFKTYLFAIARNKAVDHIRHERRFSALSEELSETALVDYDSVEQNVLVSDELRHIKEAIRSLHADYATYLHLSVFEELENEEIAKIMKKSKKQITNIAYRAKKALSEALGKEVRA